MLTSFKLQQYDEVGNADADDAGEGAAADVEISIATQGSNILNLLQKNLQTLDLGAILLHHQGLLQRGGQHFEIVMGLLRRHGGEVKSRHEIIYHQYKAKSLDNVVPLRHHNGVWKEGGNCEEQTCYCSNLSNKE